MRRIVSTPSITGMWMSSSTMSNGWAASLSSASWPLTASVIVQPCGGEEQLDDLTVDRVVVGEQDAQAPEAFAHERAGDEVWQQAFPCIGACARKVKRKTEPRLTSLVTVMSPPIRRASCRARSQGRDPSRRIRRVLASSAWVKAANSRPMVSPVMPMPVSRTSTATRRSSPVSLPGARQDRDAAGVGVNLTALEMRLLRHCPTRTES